MAGSMNKVILVGRLGADPKISYTQSGQAVANFNMATDEGYKDKNTGQRVEKTEWHRIVDWGYQAEFCSNYLRKGSLVLTEGKIQTRKWQDQNGQDRSTTEIVAQRVQGLDGRGQVDQQGQQQYGGQQQNNYQQPQQQPQQQAPQQQAPQQGGPAPQQPDEDLGPAFPSEASGMDDVPF